MKTLMLRVGISLLAVLMRNLALDHKGRPR